MRKPRQYTDSQMYHIILRGNNQQNLFYDDDDRRFFISRMKMYSEKFSIDIFSYLLMSNHIHIVIGNANEHMSRFFQTLETCYAVRFNHKHERSGHLFQGRYQSYCIESTFQLKNTVSYIYQNPEKAQIGKHDKYRWSSFREMTGEKPAQVIAVDKLLSFYESKEEFFEYVKIKKYDESDFKYCIKKIRISDRDAILILKKIFKTKNLHKILQMLPEEQVQCVRKAKEEGLSMGQIARLTGISWRIIRTA